jgi:hypothetical protein
MNSVNDMGLRGQREWWGPSYRNEMEARQWTLTDWHEHFRLHRKMTAGDLGLDAVTGMMLERSEQQWFDWKFRDRPDAPYSFWLGAEA